MTIKKFSKYIQEGTGTSVATNFVAQKDSDEEVTKYKPRAKGEEDFANAHKVEVHDYPVDVEGQFKGTVSGARQPNNGEKVTQQGSSTVNQPNGGGDSKRPADRKQGDMKVVNPIKEDTQLDEISPELAKRAFDARAKKHMATKGSEAGWDKRADKDSAKGDRAGASAARSIARDTEQKAKDMEKKMDRSARKAGVDSQDRYSKATDTRSPTQKYAAYRKDGGKLSYDQYKSQYLKQDFEVEGDLFEGKVMDALKDIVDNKSAKSVKFGNGKSIKIDMTSANAMLNLHKKLNDQNKKKMEDKIEQSPEMFMKLMDVAFGGK